MSDMSTSDIDPTELLPLTPASFHILLVLAAGPAHGYAIMLEVGRMTGGTAQLGSGTLYRTIQKLLGDGMIEACGGASDGDERRVPYRMTARGLSVARAETQRLATLVKIAQRRRLIGAHATARRGAQL